MRNRNVSYVVHDWLQEIIKPSDIIVDATCGQGFDTLFCLKLGAIVTAFDIQKQAIQWTQERVGNHEHVTLIQDSHAHLDQYIQFCNGIIFNLGYLPNSNKRIITTPQSTLIAFEKAYECLPVGGWMCVTFYQGHAGGDKETRLGIEWMKAKLQILNEYTYPDIQNAPIAILAKK